MKSIEMTFDGREGMFRLVSSLNKSSEPPLEYVDVKTAAAPFTLDSETVGEKATDAKPAVNADSQWTLKTGVARQVASGGRPAIQLDVTLARGDILVQFHVLAFPEDGRIVLHFTSGKGPQGISDDAMVQAIEVLPEQKPAIRINVGSDAAFVDWNSCVWSADAGFSDGTLIQSAAPVAHASPTLYDQELYRTARSAKAFRFTLTAPPGLYTVHLKFAELWLPMPGQRPMDITVNGQLMRRSWGVSAASGCVGMASDLRIDNITPDKDGHIAIGLNATGANDAIRQGIEIE